MTENDTSSTHESHMNGDSVGDAAATATLGFEILTMAIEDIYGLWEVLWACNTIFPNWSEYQKADIARKVIKDLTERGLIRLYRRHGVQKYNEPIPTREYNSILSEPTSWSLPYVDGEHIGFTATEQGRQQYRQAYAAGKRSILTI